MIAKSARLFYNEAKDTAAVVHIYVISIFDGVVNCGDSFCETLFRSVSYPSKKTSSFDEVFFAFIYVLVRRIGFFSIIDPRIQGG